MLRNVTIANELLSDLLCSITDFVKLFRDAEINSVQHTTHGFEGCYDDFNVILRAKPEESYAGLLYNGTSKACPLEGIFEVFLKVFPLEGDSAEQKAPGGAFCEREGTKCRKGLDKYGLLSRFFAVNIFDKSNIRRLIGEKYKVST